jgi:hypothetical protein
MTDKNPAPDKADAGKPKATAIGRGLPPPGPTRPSARTLLARNQNLLPILYLVGFVVLAAGIVALWLNPPTVAPPPPSPEIATLRQEVRTLQEQVARMEQRPAPAAPAPTDLAPLTARVAALEARKPTPPVDLAPVEASIAALEHRPITDPALSAKVDALALRLDALSSSVQTSGAALQGRLAPLERDAGQITALADRATRIARIQAARAALESGVKLGDLPGAPAALARYATAAPPTEASLRLSFPAVADAAMQASKPDVDDKPFLNRAWATAQELVTLRQGDHVILGDPAAGILTRARAAVDAGDLAGAVADLGALTGPAAATVAGWKAQAQGLLDARSALADMAAHA